MPPNRPNAKSLDEVKAHGCFACGGPHFKKNRRTGWVCPGPQPDQARNQQPHPAQPQPGSYAAVAAGAAHSRISGTCCCCPKIRELYAIVRGFISLLDKDSKIPLYLSPAAEGSSPHPASAIEAAPAPVGSDERKSAPASVPSSPIPGTVAKAAEQKIHQHAPPPPPARRPAAPAPAPSQPQSGALAAAARRVPQHVPPPPLARRLAAPAPIPAQPQAASSSSASAASSSAPSSPPLEVMEDEAVVEPEKKSSAVSGAAKIKASSLAPLVEPAAKRIRAAEARPPGLQPSVFEAPFHFSGASGFQPGDTGCSNPIKSSRAAKRQRQRANRQAREEVAESAQPKLDVEKHLSLLQDVKDYAPSPADSAFPLPPPIPEGVGVSGAAA